MLSQDALDWHSELFASSVGNFARRNNLQQHVAHMFVGSLADLHIGILLSVASYLLPT